VVAAAVAASRSLQASRSRCFECKRAGYIGAECSFDGVEAGSAATVIPVQISFIVDRGTLAARLCERGEEEPCIGAGIPVDLCRFPCGGVYLRAVHRCCWLPVHAVISGLKSGEVRNVDIGLGCEVSEPRL
jgi:hypothetical protein